MAGQTSMIVGSGTAPVSGAFARGADHAASASQPSARVGERSPALLRQVNEVMREGRRGQTEPQRIPFFCECRRGDCYEPVWLTADAYDRRRGEKQEPLILPGHERGDEGTTMSATVEAPRAQRREFRCATCNYGACVDREPTRCPMCGNRIWVVLALEVRTDGSAVQPTRP